MVNWAYGDSADGDVNESGPCCFLGEFVGRFITKNPRIGFDPRELYLPVRIVQGSYFLPDFLDEMCMVPGILQGVKCDFAVGIILYMIYDMIYLSTANGLTPGGSSTVHIYK